MIHIKIKTRPKYKNFDVLDFAVLRRMRTGTSCEILGSKNFKLLSQGNYRSYKKSVLDQKVSKNIEFSNGG